MTPSRIDWQRVCALADRAPSVEALRAHRLELIAAARARAAGRTLDPALQADERQAVLVQLAAPAVLERVRDCAGEPITLLKGPEAAAHWPHPDLRPLVDLDVLVRDPERLQRQLIEAGFAEIGDARAEPLEHHPHHLRTLGAEGLPIAVEVHRRVNWVDGLEPPPSSDIILAAIPSRVGIDGVLAPPPAEHAVLLAVHAWAHGPLRSVGRLLDVAALASATTPEATARVAERWGCARLWSASVAAADWLFRGEPLPIHLRWLARPLAKVREATVLEAHAEPLAHPLLTIRVASGRREVARGLRQKMTPVRQEPWSVKVRRAARAVVRANRLQREHELALVREGLAGPPVFPPGGSASICHGGSRSVHEMSEGDRR